MIDSDTKVLKGRYLEAMTNEEFFEICQANTDLVIERNRYGQMIVQSPAGSYSGFIHSKISWQLNHWNEIYKMGYVFDSSAGFTLPDNSIFAPDVSWIAKERWEALSREEQLRFAPICPDLVVEVRSPSDYRPYLLEKMDAWIRNGCRLAWLIDPAGSTVAIYRPGTAVEMVNSFDTFLSGEMMLPGLTLDLSFLKDEGGEKP